MSHSMEIWEKFIYMRIRKETLVTKNQFEFMPQKLTVEPLFSVRQLVEKYKWRGKIYVWYLWT